MKTVISIRAERKKVNVLEMKCLRSLVELSRIEIELGMKRCDESWNRKGVSE